MLGSGYLFLIVFLFNARLKFNDKLHLTVWRHAWKIFWKDVLIFIHHWNLLYGINFTLIIKREKPNSIIPGGEDNHIFIRMSQLDFLLSIINMSIVLRKPIHSENEVDVRMTKNHRFSQKAIITHANRNIRSIDSGVHSSSRRNNC